MIEERLTALLGAAPAWGQGLDPNSDAPFDITAEREGHLTFGGGPHYEVIYQITHAERPPPSRIRRAAAWQQ